MTKYKTTDGLKRHLREQLAHAANAYALELHNMWDIPATPDDYWIGGEQEPCGAPYQLHSYYFIGLDTMQYIVENDITQQEYDEYQEYAQLVSNASDRFDVPRFREWREHPERRIKPDRLERIQMLRDEIDKEIERIKGNNGFTTEL